MEYNHITDKMNIKIYEKYGARESRTIRHKCVLCDSPTSIDGSFSDKGRRLICKYCAADKFGSMWDVLEWIQKE